MGNFTDLRIKKFEFLQIARQVCATWASIHPNGRTYEWDICHRIDELPIAPIPLWLEDLISGGQAKDERATKAKPSEFWKEIFTDPIGEGRRNSLVTKVAGHLLRRYVDPFVVVELVKSWNADRLKPPLSDREVMRTIESIAKAEIRRRKGGAQ